MSMVTKLAAQKMLQLNAENKEHIKRAHALKLLYRQAELGLGELPQNYNDLMDKVASLCTQDLGVLEKALELGGGSFSFGTLHNNDLTIGGTTEQQFMASMLNDF